MRKRILAIIEKVRRLEARREEILEGLLRADPLLKGSLSLVKRRCGKPNCHCAKKPAHEVWVLATHRDGVQRCQVARQDDVEWVQQRVAIYKAFRAALRALETTHKEEKAILRGLIDLRHESYE